jgi:hypothetical protein
MTLRLCGSIPVRVLGAGRAMLVLCLVLASGIASGQAGPQGPSANREQSKASVLAVSSNSSSSRSFGKSKKSRKRAARQRGQQKIDATRAREIQEGLIREHYMDGTASGVWDAKSQSAMQRFQADNGWQSKVVPDSRALIKLGLGPDQEHLLNPKSAMTSQPEPAHASPMLNPIPTVMMPPQR